MIKILKDFLCYIGIHRFYLIGGDELFHIYKCENCGCEQCWLNRDYDDYWS